MFFDLARYFDQGGLVMWFLLFFTIFGIAITIERFFTLQKARINTGKFIAEISELLKKGGVDAAKEKCQSTAGPVASLFQAGLDKAGRGLQGVQKAIEESASVEMSLLEKRLIWLATVSNLAPMFGFVGTVIGMIGAFDAIAAAGEVEPTIVASGISEALITTAGGLLVAIPFQFFYNFFLAKVNKLVVEMEDSSTELVDMMEELKIAG